jgi:hypothetical protein
MIIGGTYRHKTRPVVRRTALRPRAPSALDTNPSDDATEQEGYYETEGDTNNHGDGCGEPSSQRAGQTRPIPSKWFIAQSWGNHVRPLHSDAVVRWSKASVSEIVNSRLVRIPRQKESASHVRGAPVDKSDHIMVRRWLLRLDNHRTLGTHYPDPSTGLGTPTSKGRHTSRRQADCTTHNSATGKGPSVRNRYIFCRHDHPLGSPSVLSKSPVLACDCGGF